MQQSSGQARTHGPDGMITALLQRKYSDLPRRVDRVVKQWNYPLCDAIKTESALRLSKTGSNDSKVVSVSVDKGMTDALRQIVMEFPDPIIWELLLIRPSLQTTVDTLKHLDYLLPHIYKWWQFADYLTVKRELSDAAHFVDALLERLAVEQVTARIATIPEDYLGAYYPSKPEIKLLWVPIGLTATMLGVSVEALTFVVLAHELVHAYTHMGHDIDDRQWETSAFNEAEIHIVEGLAQFYTESVCQRLEWRQPEGIDAFHRLLAMQAEPYTHFQTWREGIRQPREIVRRAMVECRCTEMTLYADFLSTIESAKRDISRRRRRRSRA